MLFHLHPLCWQFFPSSLLSTLQSKLSATLPLAPILFKAWFSGRMAVYVFAGALACLTGSTIAASAQTHTDPIRLWAEAAPGDKGEIGVEHDTSPMKPGESPERHVITLGNVSVPTLTVYQPEKAKATGAAVIVCPGGGYSILAINLEGTEVCAWLNSIGVTAVLLKYRVPARPGQERYVAPLQDAQRALGIVRHRAPEWGIDPTRVGILGFSAGGHLAAVASASYEKRTYPPVDEADKENCRPDFTILIYPAYLTTEKDLTKLAPEINVTPHTPQAFIAMTQDDPIHVQTAFAYATALADAKVPVELHIYPKGGHGYGLRPSLNNVSHWPKRVEDWMAAQGLLKPQP